MAKDATDEWTSRESVDIDDMRTILGEPFTLKAGPGRKNGADVLEAFMELCREREQVVRGVKALQLLDGITDRTLHALVAILEAGHFSDLHKLKIYASGDNLQVAGQKLCHFLRSGRLNDLRSLKLFGHAFRGEGVEPLAKSLQSSHPSKLEVLCLRDCLEDDEAGQTAIKVLTDTIALGHLSSLLTLDLRSNHLRDEGAESLAKSLCSGHLNQLKFLDLRNNELEDAGVESLAKAFMSGHLDSLRTLTLSYNSIGAEGAESLGKSLCSGHLSQLESLNLRDNELGDAGGESLAKAFVAGHLDKLRTLNLSLNYIGAEGAESLAKSLCSGHLSQLESLDLSWNKLGHAGGESLAKAFMSGHLDSLRTLTLSYNSIGAEGAESLGKSLCSGHLNQLESLDLSGNELGDEGGESLAKALMSGHLDSLRTLNLFRNHIEAEGAELLGKSLCSGHLNQLESLNLSENNFGDAGVESVVASFDSGNLSKLETLALACCGVGDVGAEALAGSLHSDNCGRLRQLELSRNRIGGRGVVALVENIKLGRLSELKEVSLQRHSGSKSYADDDIIEIAGSLGTGSLGGLESLYLFRTWGDATRLSPEAKRALVNSYQKNTDLVISICLYSEEDDQIGLNGLRDLNKARAARLRELQDEGEEEVTGEHGKVFFCGNPGVGKTTLRTTLTKGRTTINSTLRSILMKGICSPICGRPKREERDEREEREKRRAREPTRGIEVSNLQDEGSSTGVRPVTLALWDMAGQHDYEVLHSAFLPDLNFAGGQATFFVIVCNANNGRNTTQSAKTHLVYWLRFISSNSVEDIDVKQRRRVFVILNCFQGDTSGHDKDPWTAFLRQCKDTFGKLLHLNEKPIIIDVMDQIAVDHFKQILMKEARAMLENRKMPKICRAVEEDCREWAKKHANYPALKWHQYSFTVGKGRWKEEKLRAATEYLHEAGHLILFRRQADYQTPESQGAVDSDSTGNQETLVIMDPQWFCQDVVGNLLLPEGMVREDEALQDLRRTQSQKLQINVVKKFIFETPQVPSDKVDEVIALLSCIGLCYQLPGRPHEIFIPALIEGNDEPDWSTESSNKSFDDGVWVMGFSLVVQNPEATLLPIAVLRRLQVDLALDDNIGRKPDSDFLAGKSCIRFKCKGMDVLVQYPVDPSTLESKQDRIDILVKPLVDDSDPLTRKQQTNLAQQIARRILNIVIFSCRGVKLDQRIIKPWSVNNGWKPVLERDIQYSVYDLKRRVEDRGELQKMEWIVGNERVEEEDVLSEEDLVSFRDLIAAKLIHTEEAVSEYGLRDSDLVEPIGALDEGRKQPEFFYTEFTSGNPNNADGRILEALGMIARQMQRGFLAQKRGFCEVKESLHDTNRLLQDIKRSIRVISTKQHALNFQIQNLERFSVEEKEIAIPRFAYLTEKDQQKWWIKVKEKVVETKYLHFLCEAQFGKKVFHEVDGQEGIDVKNIKDWAKTLVPILGWTLKIGFVAAKIAANAVLPGLGLLINNEPIFSALSMGIQMAQGASEFSKGLEEVLGTAINHDSLLSSSLREGSTTGIKNPSWVQGQERQLRGDARTAVHAVLEDLTQAEMKRQVGLRKVWLDVECHGQGHVLWVCEKCFEKYGSTAHEIFR